VLADTVIGAFVDPRPELSDHGNFPRFMIQIIFFTRQSD
jgi:hypothetical protein